jgi:hypothetical protein
MRSESEGASDISVSSLRLSLRLCVSALNPSSSVSKEPLEELAGVAADFGQRDIQGLLVEVSGSPAVD